MTYRDPVIKRYFDLIKAAMPVFREYYEGDPIRIPASKLPCVILSKSETRVGQITNAEDEHGMAMVLTIVTDMRRDISDEKSIQPGISTLYELIEARDDDTLALKENTLLHVLRHNQLVDTPNGLRTDLSTITTVEYGLVAGKREPEGWSVEGQISFVSHFIQVR